MIVLPDFAVRGSATPVFVDAGFTQRGVSSIGRIDRKGSRYKLACTYGPFPEEHARVMVSRLIAGKQEGIRIPFPLLVGQGAPGLPVVDGAGHEGKSLPIRGLTPGYVCREGYWLSITDTAGRSYLHNVKTGARADASGEMTVVLNELLRFPFLDGATINLAAPIVEGLVEGDEWAWSISVDRVVPIEFTIEETR